MDTVVSSHCHGYKSVPIPVVAYIGCDYTPACQLSNTMGVTIGAGMVYPSGTFELTLVFVGFV